MDFIYIFSLLSKNSSVFCYFIDEIFLFIKFVDNLKVVGMRQPSRKSNHKKSQSVKIDFFFRHLAIKALRKTEKLKIRNFAKKTRILGIEQMTLFIDKKWGPKPRSPNIPFIQNIWNKFYYEFSENYENILS